MSPPRRRSARLASSTPKPRATPELSSLTEAEETHNDAPAQTPSKLPSKTPTRKTPRTVTFAMSSPHAMPTTPKSSAIKPPRDEMHPSQVHRSTAQEPSSALRLGFADIQQGEASPSVSRGTPAQMKVPSSQFTFQLSKEGGNEAQLSGDAQRMMDELREKASQIKKDLIAQREAEGEIADRKFAKPKGKTGRFSAAHMAEFKKMDSIEGHASAWRAQDGRFTPVVSSLKRSPSKADLDGSPTPQKRGLKRTSSHAALDDEPAPSPLKQNVKRGLSKVDLYGTKGATPAKKTAMSNTPRKLTEPLPLPQLQRPDADFNAGAKRMKKREQDDATSSRPISRDGTSLPRPKSSGLDSTASLRAQTSLSRLTSPTKASAAHSIKPTISLVKSPSKDSLASVAKSQPTIATPSSGRAADLKRRIISPGRLQRVTSLLRRNKPDSQHDTTAIPKPALAFSQTPNPPRTDKALPPVPLTTPRRKLSKHVSFTPDTVGFIADQSTPSPKRSLARFGSWRSNAGSHYPTLDGILKKATSTPDALNTAPKKSSDDDISYPDLSTFKSPLGVNTTVPQSPGAEPGKFTFRADHTIEFGGAPASGFGASPGQASIRHIRGSLMPTVNMPGNFPDVPTSPISHPNKENKRPIETLSKSVSPAKITGVAHGIANKKRHRPTWEEEEAEAEDDGRAAKRQKNTGVPEGAAVVAPRPIAATPQRSAKKLQSMRSLSRTPGSPSPVKRSGGISLSRLNMLARPKNRA